MRMIHLACKMGREQCQMVKSEILGEEHFRVRDVSLFLV